MSEAEPRRHVPHEVWPTYALRAWLTALQAQTRRAQEDLETRIETHEKEIARLRRQRERAGEVLQSLHETIDRVDERLRQVRDSEVMREAAAEGPRNRSR